MFVWVVNMSRKFVYIGFSNWQLLWRSHEIWPFFLARAYFNGLQRFNHVCWNDQQEYWLEVDISKPCKSGANSGPSGPISPPVSSALVRSASMYSTPASVTPSARELKTGTAELRPVSCGQWTTLGSSNWLCCQTVIDCLHLYHSQTVSLPLLLPHQHSRSPSDGSWNSWMHCQCPRWSCWEAQRSRSRSTTPGFHPFGSRLYNLFVFLEQDIFSGFLI